MLDELSLVELELLQINNLVFVILVSGIYAGLKLVVYTTGVPKTNLRLETKAEPCALGVGVPNVAKPLALPNVPDNVIGVPPTPLIYVVTLVPTRTIAMCAHV